MGKTEEIQKILLSLAPEEKLIVAWNWISENVSMEFIDHYIDRFPWNFWVISSHPDLIIEFVMKHRDRDWDTDNLNANESISLDDIEYTPEFPRNRFISYRDDLTTNFVIKHLDWEWDWDGVCEHILDPEKLYEMSKRMDEIHISIPELLENENISEALIDELYTTGCVSCLNVSMDYIRDHYYYWVGVFQHPEITMDLLIELGVLDDKKIIYPAFQSRNIRQLDTARHPEFDYDCDSLASGPNATLEFLLLHICSDIDYFITSPDFYYEYFHLYDRIFSGSIGKFIRNPNMTFDIFEKHRLAFTV